MKGMGQMQNAEQMQNATFEVSSRHVVGMGGIDAAFHDTWRLASVITEPNGKPFGNALVLLSYVIDSYRPIVVRSCDGSLEQRQRFQGQEMRFRYDDASRVLGGMSRFQLRRALVRLSELGFIGMRYESTVMGVNSALYVWPVVDALRQAFPSEEAVKCVQSTAHVDASEAAVGSKNQSGCVRKVDYTHIEQNGCMRKVNYTHIKESINSNESIDSNAITSKKEKKKKERPRKSPRGKYDKAMSLAEQGRLHSFKHVSNDGFELVYGTLERRWKACRYGSMKTPTDVSNGETPFDVVPNRETQRMILRPWIDELVGMCGDDVSAACKVVEKCVNGSPTRNISYALGKFFGPKGDVGVLEQVVGNVVSERRVSGSGTSGEASRSIAERIALMPGNATYSM